MLTQTSDLAHHDDDITKISQGCWISRVSSQVSAPCSSTLDCQKRKDCHDSRQYFKNEELRQNVCQKLVTQKQVLPQPPWSLTRECCTLTQILDTASPQAGLTAGLACIAEQCTPVPSLRMSFRNWRGCLHCNRRKGTSKTCVSLRRSESSHGSSIIWKMVMIVVSAPSRSCWSGAWQRLESLGEAHNIERVTYYMGVRFYPTDVMCYPQDSDSVKLYYHHSSIPTMCTDERVHNWTTWHHQ